MWWGRFRSADVYVSGTQRWWRGPEGATTLSGEQAASALEDWVLQRAKAERVTRLRLWLGGSLCRLTMSQGIGGTRGRDDAELALTGALRAQGAALATEVVRLPAPIELGGRGIALLASESILNQIASIEKVGIFVASVKPWWAPLVEHELGAGDAAQDLKAKTLAVFDSESLSVLTGHRAEGWSVSTYSPVVTASEVQRILTRSLATAPESPVGCAWLRKETFADRRDGSQCFDPIRTRLRGDRFDDGL